MKHSFILVGFRVYNNSNGENGDNEWNVKKVVQKIEEGNLFEVKEVNQSILMNLGGNGRVASRI